MFYKNIMAMLWIFMILTVGLAFAEICPTLPTSSTFQDNIVRYDNMTDGFYQVVLSGTAVLEHQYGPDNCLFDGKITIESADDPLGNPDPVFSTLEGVPLGFVGVMTVDGKKVKVNRSIGSWHETGVMTNHNRSPKTYMDSEYVIEDKDISGKGKTTGIMNP